MAETTDSKSKKVDNIQNMTKSPHALREEKVLAFWKEKDIFQKTLGKESPKGEFVFYDGPPFATGLPHYGHILPGTIKDVIPRYKTMQGFHVRRRWGWDTHGLPVENLIEKELGLKSKKDIIDYGVGKFNDAARKSVMRFADEWREIVPRLGRWVDMENDYRTMDASYTETVWWIFKNLYEKGLIYEGFKSMNLCPRCETTLSNFEVAQGYKDITDISVTVKFKLNSGQKIGNFVTDEKTFMLAWTTTPWTLPGNVALTVGKEIEYVRFKLIETSSDKILPELYYIAKDRLTFVNIPQGHHASVTDESLIKGSDLVGLSYEPLFDYYAKNSALKNKENGWKVYCADFVTTEDGTGIVHIAPAFGADDYNLLLANDLPFVQHVTMDGHFKPEVKDFAGLVVKPIDSEIEKDAHQKTDIEVIKWLAHHGKLFAKEKLIHSYPHCWRCYTPLLNYATSSWFVKVTDLKDKLVKANKDVEWVPGEIGSGRFGNWLEGARDWAISRSRFWGAPIPVWKEVQGQQSGAHENYHVIGSVSDLKKFSKAKNTYYIIRHGEAENNVRNILSGRADNPHHLTEKGKEQVKIGTETLKKMLGSQQIDHVFISPFIRTRETAKIVCDNLGISSDKTSVENKIGEWNTGVWNGKSIFDFIKEFPYALGRFEKTPEGGESYADMKKRMGDFLYDTENKYSGKNILIVTHETPATLLIAAAAGYDRKITSLMIEGKKHGDFYKNAEVRKLDFSPLPHNAEYELDLHRPFIDEIDLRTEEGIKLVRVLDVFDCWFESGAMPYGEAHYPFCNEDKTGEELFEPKSGWFKKPKGFPADFIAEGLDQTRGWFYSMMVLGVALFGKSPYKKVIVNGLVLAEDGQKMSKSKKNYPDPMIIVEKYGADSLRYYMMSSPAVRAQDLCFSEKGVDEVTKKIINRLQNVASFYAMYVDKPVISNQKSEIRSQNILDQWAISRLNETVLGITNGLELGEIDRATRPIIDFIDDLSTWYLRRSRDRFKGDDLIDRKAALETTKYILLTLVKVMAPFTPFFAEHLYQEVVGGSGIKNGFKESVHLESWPEAGKVDETFIKEMTIVRGLSSNGLEARTIAKINVRQPLARLKVKSKLSIFEGQWSTDLLALVKDEVNVKEVAIDQTIEKDVELDLNITGELREEGEFRELLRKIQDMRKEKGLSVGDKAIFIASADMKPVIDKYENEIKKLASISTIEYGDTFGLKV